MKKFFFNLSTSQRQTMTRQDSSPQLNLCTLCIGAVAIALALTQSAPSQQPAPLTATIHTWGSPQMSDLLHHYEVGFHRLHPEITFVDDLRSTITAVAGVYTGRADIGLLGREIWPTESQAFASIERHAPTIIDIATGSFDVPKATFALMVFVPRANPIASLSTAQLQRLFSNTSTDPIRTWGDLGLQGPCALRPIHLYGFSVDNDKSQIFAQLIFHPGDRWNATLHESANTPATDAGEAILRAVAADPDAIGISNLHYATPAVKAISISTPSHPSAIPPTRETVSSRLYPLTRAVYMVVNNPVTPATKAFLDFVLGPEGHKSIEQEGNYLPLPDTIALQQLQELNKTP